MTQHDVWKKKKKTYPKIGDIFRKIKIERRDKRKRALEVKSIQLVFFPFLSIKAKNFKLI